MTAFSELENTVDALGKATPGAVTEALKALDKASAGLATPAAAVLSAPGAVVRYVAAKGRMLSRKAAPQAGLSKTPTVKP